MAGTAGGIPWLAELVGGPPRPRVEMAREEAGAEPGGEVGADGDALGGEVGSDGDAPGGEVGADGDAPGEEVGADGGAGTSGCEGGEP